MYLYYLLNAIRYNVQSEVLNLNDSLIFGLTASLIHDSDDITGANIDKFM